MENLNNEMWDHFNNRLNVMNESYHTRLTKEPYNQIERDLSLRNLLVNGAFQLSEFTERVFDDWLYAR